MLYGDYTTPTILAALAEGALAKSGIEQSDVGGGIVFDGKLFEGNGGAGAELEHEVIRMGGGISAQGETLTKPLQRKLNALKLGGKNSASVKIVAATLGNDAGIYGTAERFSDRSE